MRTSLQQGATARSWLHAQNYYNPRGLISTRVLFSPHRLHKILRVRAHAKKFQQFCARARKMRACARFREIAALAGQFAASGALQAPNLHDFPQQREICANYFPLQFLGFLFR